MPRKIAVLCELPLRVRYLLALDLGFKTEEVEKEYTALPVIQQASTLYRMLKEHDRERR